MGTRRCTEEHLWNLLHEEGIPQLPRPRAVPGGTHPGHPPVPGPVYVLSAVPPEWSCAESVALASGLVRLPDDRAARPQLPHRSGPRGVCYLLYAPMHFLDIEIDLQTFRPEAFGIPLLLDAVEGRPAEMEVGRRRPRADSCW